MFDVAELLSRYSVEDRARPHLRANFVASLDGAATLGGLSGGLNDAWDEQVFDLLRRLADVVIVGAGTLRAEGYGGLRLDDEAVAWRRDHGLPEHPVLAAVSARLDLDPESPLFAEAPTRPLVLTHEAAPADRRRALAEVADVVDCGEEAVDPARLREQLVARGLPQMLCEGGPTLFGTLIAGDAVDELCLTLSPVLVGGGARRISDGPYEQVRDMRLGHAIPGGTMLFLRYLRNRS